MSVKPLIHLIAVGAMVVWGLGTGSVRAQVMPPPAPRPADPLPPDPPKPFEPPQPAPSPRLPITIGPPSAGAAHEKPPEEEIASAAAFIQQAGYDDALVFDLAKLAQSKATRGDVRAYAQMLAADHQRIHDDLTAVAERKKVKISTDLTPADKDAKAQLEHAQGAAFDRAFVDTAVARQANAVSALTTASGSDDPDVKAFTARTLPTLKDRLAEGEKLQTAIK